jgi:hypothetical protein
VRFSGTLHDVNGKPLTNLTGVTFYLYKEEQGGAPLFLETQNVQPDTNGHYSVALGASASHGLPGYVFASGEARWLAIQPEGQPEQPRVLLLSVPYAMKALDAETLGGRPASAYLLANPGTAGGSASTPISSNGKTSGVTPFALGGGGTANYLSKWTSGTNLGNSALYQNSSGNIGISTTSPGQKLEVDSGNFMVKGTNNFKTSGQTAFVYVGDANHPIEAINSGGLALGAYLVPQAVYIADSTGHVGIGTTSPGYPLTVSSSGVAADFVTSAVGGDIIHADGPDGTVFSVNSGSNNGGSIGVVNVTTTNSVSTDGLNAYSYSDIGVFGSASPYSEFSVGVWGDGVDTYGIGNMAGWFNGDVYVNGNLSKSSGSFKIDHPLDPANKYLYHSFVESPDMKNIYDGEVVLDGNGEAVVRLPDWFESLNQDFRYQLTAVGAPAPNLHIKEKVHGNAFAIGGGVAGMEVSWQVTGIRHDAWANAHRLQVEVPKRASERGYYLHPELFGAPEERGVTWAKHPKEMRHLKELREHGGKPPVTQAKAK